jgi:hypothetical protein
MDMCVVTGTLYNADGNLVVGMRLYVRRVELAGSIITTDYQPSYTSDAFGVVTMSLPQGSRVTLYSLATGFDDHEGVTLSVPDAPTGTLEQMLDIAAYPAIGLVVKTNGAALAGHYGDLNFSTSFSLTAAPTGQANVFLAPATNTILGGVKAGTGVTILPDGTLNVPAVSQEIVQDYLATFFNATAPVVATYNDALDRVDLSLSFMPVNPNGVAGGQTINGGTGAGESLTLSSTVNATKGSIFFGASSVYDGAAKRLGIETTSPGYGVDIQSAYNTQLALGKTGQAGFMSFRRGTDGAIASTIGYASAGDGSGFSINSLGGGGTLTFKATATVNILSGNTLSVFFGDSAGLVGINKTSSIGAQLHVVAKDATTFGQIIQMALTPNGITGIPFQVWDSTGAPKFTVTTGGAVQAGALSLFSGGLYTNMGGLGYHAGKLTLISTAGVFFSSTTSIDGTQDLSVTRGGVNILQVGDGAANANGTISAAVHLAGLGASGTPSFSFVGRTNSGMYSPAANQIGFNVQGADILAIRRDTTDRLVLSSTTALEFSSAGATGTTDLVLLRDAVDTLALRRSTNIQTLNIYSSFTDVSNYKRFAITHDSSGTYLRTEGSGTGAAFGNLTIVTGSAARWQFNNTPGSFIPITDVASDIGSTSFRVRDAYIGRTLTLAQSATGSINLVVKAIALQSVNLQEWQDSSGVAVVSVGTAGLIKTFGATVNDFISIGGTTSKNIVVSSNALGAHYQLIGDTTGGGGPAELRFGSGALITWRSTGRADAGTSDSSLTRQSPSVIQAGDGGANANGTISAAVHLGGAGGVSAPTFSFSAQSNTGVYYSGASSIAISIAGTRHYDFAANVFSIVRDTAQISLGAAADLTIYRDAADTLALRRGGTSGTPVPQTFRLYNWWDGTNGSWLTFNAGSTTSTITLDSTGTGVKKDLIITSATVGEIIRFKATSNGVQVSQPFVGQGMAPMTDNFYNVGSASFRYLDGTFSGTLKAGTVTASTFSSASGSMALNPFDGSLNFGIAMAIKNSLNFVMSNNNILGWNNLSNNPSLANLDTTLTRAAANVIQAGDGGSNANGTFKAARFQFSATVTPTGSADAQGSTGDVRYDDNFVYVKASTGWKRAALSTF